MAACLAAAELSVPVDRVTSALPGCVARGDSFDECLAEMREAVEFHIQGLRADGSPVPMPNTRAATVDAA